MFPQSGTGLPTPVRGENVFLVSPDASCDNLFPEHI